MRFINGLRSSSSLSVDDADFSDELLSKGMTHSYRMLCDIVHPACQFPLVCVAPSSVCEGRGVYATTFIPKGSFITAYAGSSRGPYCPSTRSITKTEDCADGYDYLYECSDGMVIDGAVPEGQRCRWMQLGVAQLTNDAIHKELHGDKNIDNNVAFAEVNLNLREDAGGLVSNDNRNPKKIRVYIVAMRDIKPGEELLCAYGMSYWLHKYSNHISGQFRLPLNTANWLSCHYSILKTMRQAFVVQKKDWDQKVYMREYVGVTEDGIAEYVMDVPACVESSCKCKGSIRRWKVHLFSSSDDEQDKIQSHGGHCAGVTEVVKMGMSCAKCDTIFETRFTSKNSQMMFVYYR